MEITITRNPNPVPKPNPATLGFGKYFTDHMFLMDYKDGAWRDARIVPFGPLPLHPASTTLHYGAEIFEGMKAYRRPDGQIQLFRPEENFRRMNSSAERICLPTLDEIFALKALKALVDIDRDWVPSAPGTSLYLRPFMLGNDEQLGVHTIQNAIFCIIMSPVGNYYKEGLNPVKIMIETRDVRAVRGGTGYTKCGGNYAAANRAGAIAEKMGYSQVLWLDGVERRYIEEVGSMNVMFLLNDTVVTPQLVGSVLPGITRKSCLELLREMGIKTEERLLSVEELSAALKDGTLKEAWGCGTAAVITPIGELRYGDAHYTVTGGKIGALTQKLYDTLTGIQWGKLPDTHHWTEIVK